MARRFILVFVSALLLTSSSSIGYAFADVTPVPAAAENGSEDLVSGVKVKANHRHKQGKSPPPTNLRSGKPSNRPSLQPGICIDEAKWSMPRDISVYQESPFAGKNCEELEAMILPEGHADFCKAIAQTSLPGKCALEACCFCGGGTHVEIPCTDLDEWQLGPGFGCAEIKTMSADPEAFCDSVGSFASNGMNASDACCECGGGQKHAPHYPAQESRRLSSFDDDTYANATSTTTRSQETQRIPNNKNNKRRSLADTHEIDKRESTTRIGFGDSPGIANLEYLGIGYDSIRGNPRGSLGAEIDPGFRYRIFQLVQDQDVRSVDQDYMVPLGTELKYTSSCKYDSQSEEISSGSDYRSSLAKEATFKTKVGASAQGQFGKVAGKIEAEVSFSGSEKFERFSSTSIAENTVTFDARAVCSEFEVSFNPYAKKILDDHFNTALKALPIPYVSTNPVSRSAYSKFFTAYGTHYVDKVVLGAKRILSTKMSTQDYAKLTKDSVDVADTLSVDIQLAIGSPKYVKDALTSSDCASVVNNNNLVSGPPATLPNPDDEKVQPGVSLSGSYDSFSSSSRQSENALKISKKKITTSEVNIGGTPDVDWRVWAASVKDKPMPISYNLIGLWESDLMSQEQADAFFEAIVDIEQIDLRPAPLDPLLDLMHFGVSSGTGGSIGLSSVNPNANYRALLEVGDIPKIKPKGPFSNDQADTERVIYNARVDTENTVGYSTKFGDLRSGQDGYYACGLGVKSEMTYWTDTSDEESIGEIYLQYCNVNDWRDRGDNPLFEILGVTMDQPDTTSTFTECDENEFIDGIRVMYCGLDKNSDFCINYSSTDHKGIHGINISCNKIGGTTKTRNIKRVFCDDADHSNAVKCKDEGKWEDWVYLDNLEEDGNAASMRTFITGGMTRRGRTDKDRAGVIGLKVTIKQIPNPTSDGAGAGPSTDIVTYTAVWKGKIDRPTPIFATTIRGGVARNRKEEKDEFGFTEFINGKTELDFTSNVPFAISTESNTASVVAVTNFAGSLEKINLKRFSFLTLENTNKTLGSIATCVVGSDGSIINKQPSFDLGFEVMKLDDDHFHVSFSDSTFSKPPGPPPTIVVFPTWYTSDGLVYPRSVADITCALVSQKATEFEVKCGQPRNNLASHLGFNFLAISSSADNSTVKHGFISTTPGSHPHRLYGLKTPINEYSSTTSRVGLLSGIAGGMLVEFDTAFSSLPSVIVTPSMDSDKSIAYEEGGEAYVPRCIVESLTEKAVYVKCGIVKSSVEGTYTFTPINFNIVAVGPVSATTEA